MQTDRNICQMFKIVLSFPQHDLKLTWFEIVIKIIFIFRNTPTAMVLFWIRHIIISLILNFSVIRTNNCYSSKVHLIDGAHTRKSFVMNKTCNMFQSYSENVPEEKEVFKIWGTTLGVLVLKVASWKVCRFFF